MREPGRVAEFTGGPRDGERCDVDPHVTEIKIPARNPDWNPFACTYWPDGGQASGPFKYLEGVYRFVSLSYSAASLIGEEPEVAYFQWEGYR